MLLGLLTSRAGIIAIVCALVLGVIGVQTARLGHAKADLAALRAADKAAALDVKAHEATAGQISGAAKAEVTTERVRVRTVTKTLIQEVPVYVPAAADSKCVVPTGFVLLHDAAAAGVPGPPGGPVEAASGVQLSSVLATVIGNYGVAHDWRTEALGWRAWYVDQKAAWDKR